MDILEKKTAFYMVVKPAISFQGLGNLHLYCQGLVLTLIILIVHLPWKSKSKEQLELFVIGSYLAKWFIL